MIIGKTDINTGRQIEVDLLKASCYPYDQMPNLFNDYFFE